jgi:hypothetical protein
MEEQITINWSQAEVQQGDLVVPFAEQPTMEWCHTFSGKILPVKTCECIELSPDQSKLLVTQVKPGYAKEVRKHLDKLVNISNKHRAAMLTKMAREGGQSDDEMLRHFREVA